MYLINIGVPEDCLLVRGVIGTAIRSQFLLISTECLHGSPGSMNPCHKNPVENDTNTMTVRPIL